MSQIAEQPFLSGCTVAKDLSLLAPASINVNAGSKASTVSIDVYDSDVYSSRFVTGAETSVPSVYSGRFAVDPLSHLAVGSYATAISEKMSLGTLAYRVFQISSENPLTISVVSYPPALGKSLETKLVDGKLIARVQRGLIMVVR